MTEQVSNIISGVFAYAKVAEPALKYQSTDKEFSIDIIVDKATFKAFGKRFPKQKGKTVDNDDFKGIYKIELPYEDQDEQYVLKLKKPAQYKDGEALPKEYWPAILIKNENNKAVPIKNGVLIANGSKGKVSFDVTENDFGTFAKLKSVLVEKLIEYKKAGGDPAADFGLELEETTTEFDSPNKGEDTPKEVKNPPKKVSKPKVEPEPEDEFDEESLPF